MFVFRKSFVGLLSVALAVTACSQMPEAELGTRPDALTPQFGTQDDDAGNLTLVSRKTDAVYVVGQTRRSDFLSYENDAFLRRYKPDGTLAWRKVFNDAATEEFLGGLAEDAQGNIAVVLVEREEEENGNSESTHQLLKYTSAGQELWRRPVSGFRAVFGVHTTPTGGFLLVGDDSAFRGLLRSYDRNGTLQWTKRYAEQQLLGDSATDSAGNLYVVFGDAIQKFNPAGNLAWKRTVPAGTADSVYIYDIAVVRDSLVVLGDKTWVLNDDEYNYEDESDVLVARYDASGRQLWDRTFGTRESDSGEHVAVDSNANVYAFARLTDGDNPSPNGLLVLRKYTFAGTFLKQTVVAKNLDRSNDRVTDMAVYRDDEVYLTGQTTHDLGAGYAGGFTDAFLMRVNGQGSQVWVR